MHLKLKEDVTFNGQLWLSLYLNIGYSSITYLKDGVFFTVVLNWFWSMICDSFAYFFCNQKIIEFKEVVSKGRLFLYY
jgi:hypothetical protein